MMINPLRGVRREGVGDRGAGALTLLPVGTKLPALKNERKGNGGWRKGPTYQDSH